VFNNALVIAGGEGRRLRPLTSAIPKPLLPVGDKPIVQLILEHLASYGITDIYMSVNYKKELIKSFLRDGSRFGVEITYLEEDSATGTAGSLSLLPKTISAPVLVTNADIVCDVDLETLFRESKRYDMVLTAVRKSLPVPYGVLDLNEDGTLSSWQEKPQLSVTINAGIYAVGSAVLKEVRYGFGKGSRVDMPDLWSSLLQGSLKVGVLLHEGKWTDVGRMEDYMSLTNTGDSQK